MWSKRKYVSARPLIVVAVGAGLAISGSSQRAVAHDMGYCCRTYSSFCCYDRPEFRIECEHSPTGYCFGRVVEGENPEYNKYRCNFQTGYADGPSTGVVVTCQMKLPICTDQSPTGCKVEDDPTPLGCFSWDELTGDYDCE